MEFLDRARELYPQLDLDLFEDHGVWIWRIGDFYSPDPELLTRGTEPDYAKRVAIRDKYVRDVNDYWFHVYQPKPGDTIVDIGAGRGEDVYVFSQSVGPTGRVWAIEPHPTSFAALERLVRWNKLANVTALRYACVEQPSTLEIETMPVWESNYVRTGAASASSFSVEGVVADDLLAHVPAIDFLKMNIEGAERQALPGCRKLLERTRTVCIAAHDFRADRGEGEDFRTLAFVREFLADAGFTLITRDSDPRYYVPYHVHGVRSA